MKTYDWFTTDLRPIVKIYEDLLKTKNAAAFEKWRYEGLRRVMNCRGCSPDDEEPRLTK